MTTYRFGRFELQPHQRRLLNDGHPVELGHRAIDVLLALVERAGQLVTKDQLLGRVWPGVVVEENNLQVQVSTLRKVLGPAAIATTAGRGYCFTLELMPGSESSSLPQAPRHNLPTQLTSFIGHDDDLEEYAALLEQTRLLTLTGIGGCGKTRLALELAKRVLQSFPDGVWYVDLASLMDAGRVALTIATLLGIPEENDRRMVDTLCDRLAGKQTLLVLDNCEHLVAACAAVVQRVVGAASGVRVLAASREGLSVGGERTVTVRSLSFPAPGSKLDPAALDACEAVRLFVERARLLVPRFSLGDDTRDAVAEICRRLDGIPLAVELAAARVKMLTVEEIRARLGDRFRLLTGGSRTAMARQQTLLATIQWSFDHLAPDQRQLLQRLSVFVGGWTLASAARVAAEQPDEYAVLDVLTRLVEQSLVTTNRVEGGTTRYTMLETVRQYAQDRLNQSGEGEATRDRHLAFFVALAEEAEPQLVGQEQGAWFARLDLERENLLAAHSWCDHAEDGAELGLRLVFSSGVYLLHRGLVALRHRVTEEALTRRGAEVRSLARCRALWAAGEASYFMGRYVEAKEYVEASLSISRDVGNREREAEALRLLGFVVLAGGNRAIARAHFQDALALSRQLGDKRQLSRALHALGVFYYGEKREEETAQHLFEEALALNRERGDRAGVAINLSNLGTTSIALGLGDRARDMLREGFSIAEDIGSKRAGIAHLSGASELAILFGEWNLAARLYGAAEAQRERIGHHPEPGAEVSIERAREALGDIAFAAAESDGRSLSYDEAIAQARAWLDEGSSPFIR
ncbi:MAG TPA: tetratricopeptide repeat protein [Usitatibacter sp.]|nr:tetratricopeptide repeat protein [Usitatibacter sp.]